MDKENPFKDKERGDEIRYFNKQDEEALKGLMKKMRGHFDPAHAELGEAEVQSQLSEMFRKHNIKASPELYQELKNWKNY